MPPLLTAAVSWRSGLAAILLMAACMVSAEEYLDRDAFLALAFADSQPEMATLWLTDANREAAREAVGWAPAALRLRYWSSGSRTAWILEEIGKEKPITLGVVISDRQIARLEVLAFRESRGWEIRYPFFTEQFSGLELDTEGYLSEPIDGITGATLSVRATERVARLALWLDAQVRG
ncbi:FMN-binding protein [Pseudomonadota bacterium]